MVFCVESDGFGGVLRAREDFRNGRRSLRERAERGEAEMRCRHRGRSA